MCHSERRTLWSIKIHHTVGGLLLSPSGMFYVQSEDEERVTDGDRERLERDLRFDLVYDIV
jgi:hypothetical protein